MQAKILFSLIVFGLVIVTQTNFSGDDFYLPIKALIEKHGYPFEEHDLVTPDGYILKTHRIPYGKLSKTNIPNKKPLLFVHGMSVSSESILILGPERGLGFLLADNGYDVWLMNSRGNYYSRNHTKYIISDRKFWHFTFHEIGIYDVSTNIDYILGVTNQRQISYIGHSQGSTVYFVLMSERPEYNEKINLHIAFGPAVYLRKSSNRLGQFFSTIRRHVEFFAINLKLYELFPPMFLDLIQKICQGNNGISFCLEAAQYIMDTESKLLDEMALMFIGRTSPCGVSIYQMLHFFQLFKLDVFQQYDFGSENNLLAYNSTTPPVYDLKKCIAPSAIMYAQNDSFASEEQTNYLIKQLPNVVDQFQIPVKEFSHIDFIGAINAKEVLYDHVLNILDKYT